MKFFKKPTNLPEAYGVGILLLNLAGLFPFRFNQIKNKFQISWTFYCLTIAHISLYTYVNMACLMENWLDFAQPMIGHSSLTAFGNLLLRLMAMVITYLILAPLLLGSPFYVSSLNIYVEIIEKFIVLGIDVQCIYLRVYYLNWFASVIILLTLLFTAWHNIFFYELITQQSPDLKFYFVAFLNDFYKILFLFYGNLQFFGIFLLSKQLNGFLKEMLEKYKGICEEETILALTRKKSKNMKKKW